MKFKKNKQPNYMKSTISISNKYGIFKKNPKIYSYLNYPESNLNNFKIINSSAITDNIITSINFYDSLDSNYNIEKQVNSLDNVDNVELGFTYDTINHPSIKLIKTSLFNKLNREQSGNILENSKKIIDQLVMDDDIQKSYTNLSILQDYIQSKVSFLRDAIKGNDDHIRPPDKIIL